MFSEPLKVRPDQIMFSIANKISLVTGAGSGIGAAIAETFAQAGAFVFVADRDEKADAKPSPASSGKTVAPNFSPSM